MRNTLVLILIFVSINMSFGQKAVDKFFDKLEDRDDYAVISVNREMFKMLASLDLDSEEPGLKEMLRNIKMLKVYIKESDASLSDFNEINNLIKGNLNNLVSVKNKEERIMLYTGPGKSDDIVDGIVLLVHGEKENVFIKIDGIINLNQLGALSKKLNIKGLDSLQQLDKKSYEDD